MSIKVKETIHANGIDISVYTSDLKNEYISLTDIARFRSADPRITIHTWLRSRDVVEFLGLWECLNNPVFKRSDFDTFKKDAGTNAYTFSIKEWRDANPGKKGNIRDNADLHHLLVLANLESYNAILLEQSIPQEQRLDLLRHTAETQLRTILGLHLDSQLLLTR